MVQVPLQPTKGGVEAVALTVAGGLGVVGAIGADRLDPATVERVGLGGRESRTGRLGTRADGSQDPDGAACRLEPINAQRARPARASAEETPSG